jgi:hypothetical protein
MPEEWQKTIAFERAMQIAAKQDETANGIPYLHRSLKPIDQVDFRTEEERGQGSLFGNECTGLCGV